MKPTRLLIFSLCAVAAITAFAIARDSRRALPSAVPASVISCIDHVVPSTPMWEEAALFRVASTSALALDGAVERYTAAFPSPTSPLLAFMAPTNEVVVLSSDQVAADALLPAGISKTHLVLYDIDQAHARLISTDSAAPVWAPDGRSLHYLSGGELRTYSLASGRSLGTGLLVPQGTAAALASTPRPDGSLLAPEPSTGELRTTDGAHDYGVTVTFRDRVSVSPRGSAILVRHGSYESPTGEIVPHRAVIVDKSGSRTILESCALAAEEVVWAWDDRAVAFPLAGGAATEIHILNTVTGSDRVLLRTPHPELIYGLSWSHDNQYLAFTLGDPRDAPPNVYVARLDDGVVQLLAAGARPRWIAGDRQLVAETTQADGRTRWSLITIDPSSGK